MQETEGTPPKNAEHELIEVLTALFGELLGLATQGGIAGCALTVVAADGQTRFAVVPGKAGHIHLIGAVEVLKSEVVGQLKLNGRSDA